MDERLRQSTPPSNTTCPLVGPRKISVTTPPAMLKNPIPHQGVINTQQDTQPPPPQVG
jgi:hypothetical protein